MSLRRRAQKAGRASFCILFLASWAGAQNASTDWAEIPGTLRAEGPAVTRVPTVALILGGQSGGPIDLSVMSIPLPVDGPKQRVAVLAEIERLQEAIAAEAPHEIYVYAVGTGGEVASAFSQSVTIDAARLERKRGFKTLAALELAPGQYTLRVLVRHGDEHGLRVQSLGVPPPSEVRYSPYAAWWLEPLDSWLLVLPAGGSEPPIRPITVDGRAHFPAARLRLEDGSPAFLGLTAGKVADTAEKLPVRLTAADNASSGGSEFEAHLEIVDQLPAEVPGSQLMVARLMAPELPTGAYTLRPSEVDPESGGTPTISTLSLPLLVTSGVADQHPEPAPEEAAAARGVPRKRKYRLPVDATATAYRRALGRLASGDSKAAREALQTLELEAARHVVFDQLDKIQTLVLSELAKAAPDSLLPVLLLHADMIQAYRERGQAPLAEHAQRVSIRLARQLARRGHVAAGKALTEHAGRLIRTGRLRESQDLLELALEADRSDAVARLALGVSHERSGAYEQAAEVLEPLTRDPTAAEARLRLALSLERLGKTDRSRPLLESFQGSPAPEWVRVLAAEEWIKIAIREQRFDLAVRRLDQALERWPRHRGLQLQHALVLDRSGDPRAASETIRRLVAAPEAPAPSPRDRYNSWPASEADRQALRDEASEHLPDLERALEATER